MQGDDHPPPRRGEENPPLLVVGADKGNPGLLARGFLRAADYRRIARYSAVRMRFRVVLILSIVALALASCALPEDKFGSLLVAPGKYILYNCDEIARETQGKLAREKELQQLMARAGAGPGGRMVSVMAYESEYAAVRAELSELRKTAGDKGCALSVQSQPTGR